MRFFHLFSGLAAVASPALVAAAPSTELPNLSPRQNATCDFDSVTAPSCWGNYSLSTNWYEEAPDTGVIREYWFDIVNKTLAPDGFDRITLSINGSIPGPTIEADWGDTVVVHVTNSMQDNGTSIHWHGIRQLGSTEHDGVASITQCPVAPGDSLTYTWKATQYGTTWYHSHFSLQAWNGVIGGIIIRGPASAPYDEDKGLVVLSDWFHETTDALYDIASTGAPPQADNGLINGLNVSPYGGSRFQTNFASGSSYLLRVVNTAIDTMFRFGIDNHTLTVISTDLVPIVPYETDSINIAIGQRYEVIVKADQDPGNYWIRAIPQITCSSNAMTLNITGILTYDDLPVVEPTSNPFGYNDSCNDESPSDLVPYVSLDVGAATDQEVYDLGLATVGGFFKWTLNDNTFLSEWGQPTLEKVLTPGSVFSDSENIITLNETNTWTYLVIESQLGLNHPFHLHGHDFFVVGQEAMETFAEDSPLNLANPPRRDVAMLPAFGYLAIAFQNDNPGVWLAHCHIGWHTSQGFALQLVERGSEIENITNLDAINGTCANWNDYQTSANVTQEDSGV
ncbi:multicopper oxidase [Xylaria arbuscula]|nr:multicopper oxidase [Xylaria arbuscula]